MFNNREIVIVILGLIALLFMMLKKEIRQSIVSLLKCFLHWKILVPILLTFLYTLIIVLIFKKVNLWNFSLLKDTIFWLGAAFIMLFNYEKISKDLKKSIKEIFGLVVVLEFIAGLYAFNIIGELILVPSIVIIAMMNAVADTKKEWLPVKKLTDGILSIIGIYILIFTIFQIAKNFQDFRTMHNLESFLLPIIFTLLYLPFIYLLALFAEYELLFMRIGSFWLKDNKKLSKYAKRQALRTCLFSLNKLKKLSAKSPFAFMDVKNEIDVQKAVKNL